MRSSKSWRGVEGGLIDLVHAYIAHVLRLGGHHHSFGQVVAAQPAGKPAARYQCPAIATRRKRDHANALVARWLRLPAWRQPAQVRIPVWVGLRCRTGDLSPEGTERVCVEVCRCVRV